MEGRSHMHFIFKQTKHNILTFSFFRTISNSLHIKFPKKLFHFIPHPISLFHFLHGGKNVGEKKILSWHSTRSFSSVPASVSNSSCFFITPQTHKIKKKIWKVDEGVIIKEWKLQDQSGGRYIRTLICPQYSLRLTVKFKRHYAKVKVLHTKWYIIYTYTTHVCIMCIYVCI